MFKTSINRLITQFSISLLTAIGGILFARYLGPELKGQFTLITLLVPITMSLSNLGISQSILFYSANNKFSHENLFSFTLLFSFVWGGVISSFILFLLNDNLIELLQLNSLPKTLMDYSILSLPFHLLNSNLRALILGCQKYSTYNLIDIFQSIVWFGFTLMIVFFMKSNLLTAIIFWIISIILTDLLQISLLLKNIKPKFKNQIEIFRKSINYGIKSYITNLIQFFNYRLDNFVLNFFKGPVEVGIYSVAVSIGELLWQISTGVSLILFPNVANKKVEFANRITPIINRSILFLSILGSLFIISIAWWFIPFFYGPEYRSSYTLLLILLPGICFYGVVKILYGDLAGRGRPGLGTIITGVGFIITIVLDLVLIPKLSGIGASISSSFSYFSSMILSILFFSKISGISWKFLIIPRLSDFSIIFNILKKWKTNINTFKEV